MLVILKDIYLQGPGLILRLVLKCISQCDHTQPSRRLSESLTSKSEVHYGGEQPVASEQECRKLLQLLTVLHKAKAVKGKKASIAGVPKARSYSNAPLSVYPISVYCICTHS